MRSLTVKFTGLRIRCPHLLRLFRLAARDLGGILEDIRTVGRASWAMVKAAEELVQNSRTETASGLRGWTQSLGNWTKRRVLCIEWLDPLYFAGHWVPELVHAAGGEDVGARPGAHSTQRSWSEVVRLKPDLLLVMLCGFRVDRSEEELADVRDPEAVKLLTETETWILDGNSYSSRPGPRVVDGAIRIRAALRGTGDGRTTSLRFYGWAALDDQSHPPTWSG